MPKPSKPSAGVRTPIPRQKPFPDQVNAKFQEVSAEVVRLAKEAKDQFDRLDQSTKRKIIAGLGGVAALLALRSHHRHKKSCKQ
ncbi:MAG: hypothetical protein PHI63_01660 [Patescibacteria group bacterium]|nr:hypothetical protein [Patescibacteria group bacterium]